MYRNPRYYPDAADDRPQAPPEPAGPVLAAMLRRNRDKPDAELRLILETFNGHPYLRLQLWEQGRDGWWPVRGRSVTIRLSEAVDLARAIEAVAREHAAQGWPTPAEEPRYVERRRQRPARDWGSTELPPTAPGSGDDFDEGGDN